MKLRRILRAAAAGWLLTRAAPVLAASITGIIVYSTDDFGDPNGVDSSPGNPVANLWITRADPHWWGLAVYENLLPDSLSGRPQVLSSQNFAINIPLAEGDNYFTLVAQPASTTEGDDFQRWVVNLFFDGKHDDPGVAVLFPRRGLASGSATTRTRAQTIYSFGMQLQRVRVPGVNDTEGYDAYDDGVHRVTVPAASMLPSTEVFGVGDDLGIDLVSEHEVKPNKHTHKDFVGSLVVTVEPSSGEPTVDTGGPGFVGGGIPAPQAQPRAGAGEPNYQVPNVPAAAPVNYDDGGYDAGAAADLAEALPPPDTPTPKDAVDVLKNWIQQGIETPTPATTVTGSPAVTAVAGTATPAKSASATSPTAAATGGTATPASPTPTLTPTPATPTPSRGTTTSTPPAATQVPAPAAAVDVGELPLCRAVGSSINGDSELPLPAGV